MESNFPTALAFVLRPENDGQGLHKTPGDAGGWTNMGIIWETFVAWRKLHDEPALFDDFKNLTTAEISQIYHTMFWGAVRGIILPAGVDVLVFNIACAGPTAGIKRLQEASGAAADGIFGQKTLQAVETADPSALFDAVISRTKFWFSTRPTAPEFLHGWLRRLSDCEKVARPLLSPPKTEISRP